MAYQVLAQKYRPKTFEDVIGQEVVTRTLNNSIHQKRVANAYIFCGPRGVGKTSVARLVSKTVNCENTPFERPCNKCTVCKEISRGSSIDVLEIDGASNRGIDEIRALRENVKFSPSQGNYKIYIIDEVHMLTQEAFNALLKTLEEPPEHVKFIFATTEPHKVLPTILSRCQRFDFKKIPPLKIRQRLADVAKKEKIDIEDEALILIARNSDGSLRDSIVILDQLVSFTQEKIGPKDVMELLGMVDKGKISALAGHIIEKNGPQAMDILDQLISGGKAPVFIINGLISHFRDIMVLKTTGGKPTTDMAYTEVELRTVSGQMEKVGVEEVLYILQNLTGCLGLMKQASFARAPLEVNIIKLVHRGSMTSLSKLVESIEDLKKNDGPAGMLKEQEAEKSSFTAPPEQRRTSPSGSGNRAAERSTSSGSDEVPGNTAQPEAGQAPSQIDLTPSGYHWKALLKNVRNRKMSVYTFLNAGQPVEHTDSKVVIGFGEDQAFNKEVLEAGDNRSIIEEAVKKIAGRPLKVEFTLLEFLGNSSEKKRSVKQQKTRKSREEMKPLIEKAMDVFGGHVVRDVMEETER